MLRSKLQRDIIHRWEGNPLLTLEDIPFRCNTVFNAAATKFQGIYLLLLRIENLEGHSVFVIARSEDGYHFEVDEKPCMEPAGKGLEPFYFYEKKGVEDPRISEIDGVYYITYTAYSDFGARISLVKTTDFKNFERIALISGPGNKDCVLFPKKINGEYIRLDRPVGKGIGNIWISYSKDLVNWGKSEKLISVRNGYWDDYRIGASVPPIETAAGWLEIYHGVKDIAGGPIYRLGALLLDHKDPRKILGRSDVPILSPREYYERVGDVNNVVFSCGAVLEDNKEVKIYYGAADTSICVGTVHLQELLDSCLNKNEE
ncbi:MAG: glycoside hydrolase family 130 protein [Candidatus Margulisbacteria bacterium]|nr:glycoside hydrolase family 130 protein [Candidatus Margulisiibacteriota bacterium]